MEEAAMNAGEENRPHIIAIPFPLMGHMTPIVQLCNILVARAGCRATIVCSERAVPSLKKLLPEQHEEIHHLKVLSISDGFPTDMGPSSWDTARKVMQHGYHEGLPRSFAQHIHSFPDAVCVISDMYLSWTQDVADELGIPRLAVWVAAAAEYQVYFHAKDLIRKGTLPFKEPLGREVDNMGSGARGRPPTYHRVYGICENDEMIDIPGLPSLHRRDFPTFLQIEDSSDVFFYMYIDHIKTGLQASMVLFNTFDSLDNTLLDVMRSQGIRAYPIGPLFVLEDLATNNQVHTKQNMVSNSSKTLDGSKEQEPLGWLDKQKPHSVIYVAFGTMIKLTNPQAKEIAFGLLNSKQPFIWVYPSSMEEGRRKELPPDFLNQVEDKGLVLEWAPQKLILQHPSTGAFLSHCGWNSTLESICFGVPTLCLPYVSDQVLHCKMMVDEWNVGLRLERSPEEGIALADDISWLTQELLVGEKGYQLRKRAQELKLMAELSTEPGGSSCTTLDAIIKMVNGVQP